MKGIDELELNEITKIENDHNVDVLCQRVYGGFIYTYLKTRTSGSYAMSSAFVPEKKSSGSFVTKPVKPKGFNLG